LQGGEDPTVVSESPRPTAAPSNNNSQVLSGQTQLPSQPNQTAPAQGKTIGPAPAGQFPDFVGADLASSLAVLAGNRMSYAIIEAPSESTPKGIVISQKPASGSRSDGATITLVVSSGPPG
jgi:hypothetical protein